MIAENNRSTVLSNGVISESYFSVKQENLAHIFSILRNNLYSNKPLAILREYSTNAQDAMVEAGKGDQPIQITCPTPFDSDLSIRDFGNGLSEDQVYNIFASYGESTKRNTNDMVGMLGLGSKSAFSYAETFTVTSYNGGMKKIYTAYIDESGIGKISKIHEEESNESGLEIKVAIRRNESWLFEESMVRFFKEFNPTPIFLNNDNVLYRINSYDKEIFISGTNWELRKMKEYRTHFIKMGNVVYPFNDSNLDFNSEIASFVRNLNSSVFLYANIGDVNFTISRESLEYTERTKNYLINSLTKVSEEMVDLMTEKINNCTNYWDAKIAYRKFQSYIPQNSVFTFDDKKIDGRYFSLHENKIVTRRKYNGTKWEVINAISPEENQTFFIYKGNVSRKSIFIRAISYINDNNLNAENCYLLGFDSISDANDFFDKKYLHGQKVIDVATIPYEHLKKNRTNTFQIAKSEVYVLNEHLPYIATNKKNWVPCESSVLDNEEGVYLPIKYFKPIGFDCLDNDCPYSTLLEIKKIMESYNFKWPVIYGVKPSDVKDLNSGWIDLKTYIQNYLDEMPLSIFNEISRIEMRANIDSFWIQFCKYLEVNQEKINSEIDSFAESVNEMDSIRLVNNPRRSMAITNYGFKLPIESVVEMKNNMYQLQKKYPLLSYFRSGSVIEDLMPEIIKYVKACD